MATPSFGRFSSRPDNAHVRRILLPLLFAIPAVVNATDCPLEDSWLQTVDAAVQHEQLENGIGLYSLPRAEAQTIALASRFEVGSRHEQPRETGWAHLFEHLLFKGSLLAPGDNYSQLMNAMGGSFNASTSFDDTRYYSRFPAEGLDLVLALERDRFERPELSPQSIANQQKTVLAEMAQTIDNQPYFRAAMEYLLTQAQHTPYRHAIIGSRQDIEGATPASLAAFHQRFYRPETLSIALVGAIDQQAQESVQRHFASWQASSATALPSAQGLNDPPPDLAAQPPSRGSISDDRAPWPGLLLAWHTVGREHRDAPAIRLLELYLFQRLASGLERAGIAGQHTLLNQSLPLDMDRHGMTNLLLVPRARVSLDSLAAGVEQLLGHLATKPIDEQELCLLKSVWLGNYRSNLTDDVQLALQLAATTAKDADAPFAAPWRRIRAVTPSELSRVANHYFVGHTVRLDLQPAWYTRAGKGLLEWLPSGWADGLEDLAL